jgi:REP element-mobilizing transposase RayT
MARPLRIEYPGAFYHIINRGLERREIFRTDKDYEYFLGLLQSLREKYGLLVHSYCLMTNHYHLYIEIPNGGLSKIMRQLDGNFTQKFNNRHKRVGPLFQGRYKATLIDEDSYSLQLSKYIHLNPLKAKMVEKLEQYKWSSYPAFIGKVKVPNFLQTDWLLSQFHGSKRRAVKELKAFTLDTEDEDWSPEKEAYKGIILGDSDFVSQIQDKYLSEKSDPEIPKLRALQKQITPEEIENDIRRLKLAPKLTLKLIIYALKQHSFLSLNEIAKRMGGMHYSSISQITKRLLLQAKTDKKLSKIILEVDGFLKMSNVKT